MRAVGDNVLFEYFETNQLESGIILTKAVDADSTSIVVLVKSVGSAVKYVKDGDTILVPKLMRTPVDKEKGLFLTKESQVLAIIN